MEIDMVTQVEITEEVNKAVEGVDKIVEMVDRLSHAEGKIQSLLHDIQLLRTSLGVILHRTEGKEVFISQADITEIINEGYLLNAETNTEADSGNFLHLRLVKPENAPEPTTEVKDVQTDLE